MSWIVTPRRLAARAEFYHQLFQLQTAGIGLIDALKSQQRVPSSSADRGPLGRLILLLEDGSTFSEALTRLDGWVPDFDVALLRSGEESGRLPECCRMLGEAYRGRAAMLRELISALAYPVFLVHFGVFLFPFAAFFQSGDWAAYLGSTVGVLLPLYALVGLLVWVFAAGKSDRWQLMMESGTQCIPVLGKARRNLALARLCAALEALVSAGVPLGEGWILAAAASGSVSLRRAVDSFRAVLEGGGTPAEAVHRSGVFPELFANMYQTGEVTGRLDETLRQLHRLYEEEATRQWRALAQWVPKLVYLAVAGFVAYKVVGFYSDYFKKAMEF